MDKSQFTKALDSCLTLGSYCMVKGLLLKQRRKLQSKRQIPSGRASSGEAITSFKILTNLAERKIGRNPRTAPRGRGEHKAQQNTNRMIDQDNHCEPLCS